MTQKMKKLAVQSFRLKNFKAVRDSKTIKFTPLTVFIGNNGSGKSSIIEGLETLQTIATRGVDEAMNAWSGFEYIWHKGRIPNAYHRLCLSDDERPHHTEPLEFDLHGMTKAPQYYCSMRVTMEINCEKPHGTVYIRKERFEHKGPSEKHGNLVVRNSDGKVTRFIGGTALPDDTDLSWSPDGDSILNWQRQFFSSWQFLSMNPLIMGDPYPQKRTGGPVRLARDGSNIADYLREIREIDRGAFDGIVEVLQVVLPYASDLQPVLASELGRNVYLELTEGDFKVPGWLLSTGTLRTVALLALLRHPIPPPLIVVEEIENGLDPRTVYFLMDEIRRVVERGRSQVIITTHSPYLLDLVPIQYIVLTERVNNQTVFSRPGDDESIRAWSEKFLPGKLYTMNGLKGGRRP